MWGKECKALRIQNSSMASIKNQSLLTCVKTIQNSAYVIVLDCFYMREIGSDFSIYQFWSHWITTIKLLNKGSGGIWDL